MQQSRIKTAAKVAAVLGLAALAPLASAHGRADVNWSVTIGSPYPVAPAPVYTPPPVVYVAPQPVYVRPVPVRPQPVYVQPAPVYYVDPPVRLRPGRGWHHHHHRGYYYGR